MRRLVRVAVFLLFLIFAFSSICWCEVIGNVKDTVSVPVPTPGELNGEWTGTMTFT